MLLIFLFLYLSIVGVIFWGHGTIYLFRVIYVEWRVDLFSYSFFALLGLVSSLVAIWSYYYMKDEENYKRFFLLLSLFIIRIIMLIFFSNLFMSLIAWDALGVSSFLLVIFYKNRKSLRSGIITALTNRLGDCFFICILGFFLFNSCFIPLSFLLTLRMTKRAQFPFSSWLPAAMAAPTPVSALVHSSTLVTAGVYMLIRYCHIEARIFLIVGSLTMLIAGFRACVERDFKKVIALSTLSQLGLIFVSIGANEKSFCFFHLMSHACFKALLFICVGIFIHSLYGSQEYRSIKLHDLPAILASVSIISLIGFLFISGFYRKDQILESLYSGGHQSWSLFFFLMGIVMTTRYSTKLIITTRINNSFYSTGSICHGGSNIFLKAPLCALGILSIVFGTGITVFTRPPNLVLRTFEKTLPIILMPLGLCLGYARVSPIWRSMLSLVPLTQHNSRYMVVNAQIIEGARRLFIIPKSNFSLTIGVGLSVFMLFIYV